MPHDFEYRREIDSESTSQRWLQFVISLVELSEAEDTLGRFGTLGGADKALVMGRLQWMRCRGIR